MWLVSHPLRIGPRFVPDGAVNFFIKGGAAGGKLTQRMVLRSHQARAVRKSAANLFAIQSTCLLQRPGEIGMGERRAAEAGQTGLSRGDLSGCRQRSELLQPAIAASRDGKLGNGRLNSLCQSQMSQHTQEGMFGRVVSIDGRKLGGS